MSELEAFRIKEAEEGCPFWEAEYVVYSKIEVDKVIADKDKELRHNKYKRCLAMAMWCESEAYIYKHGSEYDEDLAAWFGKWRKRWLELAERFKPNN